jgi:hypothetical protein
MHHQKEVLRRLEMNHSQKRSILKKTLVSSCILGSVVTQAALPPYNERVREINAVLENTAVVRLVLVALANDRGPGVVTAIEAIKTSDESEQEFKVTSGSCIIEAKVKSQPVIGPNGKPVIGPPSLVVTAKEGGRSCTR